MLKNYLKIAFRNITRQKTYSLINILGLAIGMASAILIMLFVNDELSYDNYHENGERIYRLERKGNFQGKDYHVAVTAHPMGPTLKEDFAEIEKSVRIWPMGRMVKNRLNNFAEERIFFADQDVFQVFTFPMVNGDEISALVNPNSIVISQKMSDKYFGSENPLDKILTLQWNNETVDFKVTGVMEDIPQNSHFHADFFASYSSLDQLMGKENLSIWLSNSIYTYLLLKENTNTAELSLRFPAFIEKYMGSDVRKFIGADADIAKLMQFHIRPVDEIYLYGRLPFDIEPGSDINRVYIFSAIAILIMIIAGINFMNLSTARSARRAKEVGMRKVAGANRSLLIRQFLGESLLLSLISLFIAIVLVETALPAFNSFTHKALSIHYFSNPTYPISFLVLVLFVGLFSGSYPAFFLSKFKPAVVLKSAQSTTAGTGSPTLRKTLVVIQFAISITLIIGTSVVMKQLNYMHNKKLGFNKEQVLVIPSQDRSIFEKFDLVKADFKKDPAVINVGGSTKIPGDRNYSDTVYKVEGANDDETVLLRHFAVEEEFIPTLGMDMAAGRNFSKEFTTDKTDGFIINEAGVKKFGWNSAEEAIGKSIGSPASLAPIVYEYRKIIGVVKDFHFKSLHNEIEPLLMYMRPNLYYVSIKIKPDNIGQTVKSIEKRWKAFSPNIPFEYFFLDDNFNKLYFAEQRTQIIFSSFAFLAIFIASLGLFGMASFTTEQRTKEIGVRKVMGASVTNIVILLSKELTKWVLIANIVAYPIGYWAMKQWLQNFNYHIDLGIGLFFGATIIALLIATLTVSFQAIKAATSNPVNALKYE